MGNGRGIKGVQLGDPDGLGEYNAGAYQVVAESAFGLANAEATLRALNSIDEIGRGEFLSHLEVLFRFMDRSKGGGAGIGVALPVCRGKYLTRGKDVTER